MKTPAKPAQMPNRGLVLWQHLAPVIKALNPDVDISIDGAESMKQTGDGLHVRINLARTTLTVSNGVTAGYRDFVCSAVRSTP